jgi:hypothetical protein
MSDQEITVRGPDETLAAFTFRRMRNEILEEAAVRVLTTFSDHCGVPHMAEYCAVRAAIIIRGMKE